MLRYLGVAAVLLALAGTGCSNKAEPKKSTGDGPAATNATSPATGSTIKSDAGRGASTTKSEPTKPVAASPDMPAGNSANALLAGWPDASNRCP